MPTPRTRAIRVVIVDDQLRQRQGYRMVLDSQKDIEVVGEVGDGAQALALLRREEADVLLMDIQMPRVNGLVAAQQISADPRVAEVGHPPRIILVTAVEVDDHVAAAATANVFAVLFKDIDPEALLATIREAAVAGRQE